MAFDLNVFRNDYRCDHNEIWECIYCNPTLSILYPDAYGYGRKLWLPEFNTDHFSDFFTILWKEFRVAIVVGVVLALANGVRIFWVYKNLSMAVVVATSLVVTIVIAKLVGCVLPILAKRLHMDPAIMASPLITTIVDTCSIVIYFQIATLMFHIS